MLFVIILLNYECLYSQCEPPIRVDYSSNFYTNRNLSFIDTIYLPISEPCKLELMVLRLVSELNEVDNTPFLYQVHSNFLDYKSSYLCYHKEDVSIFHWIPNYSRIFPFICRIYLNGNTCQTRPNDAVNWTADSIWNIKYCRSMNKTKIGEEISLYMPFIEMYLWHKITNEITLVGKLKDMILFDYIEVQILSASKDEYIAKTGDFLLQLSKQHINNK